MPDQTPDIDAIRQREQAATEGPWRAAWPNGLHPWEVCISADVPLVELAHGEQGIADAEFIAHAREDIPALLAERDRLAAELATERREHGITDTALRQAIAELRETALHPDERQTAANFLTAYIRLCGSRLPNDHAVHALVAKLTAPATA